MENYSGEPLTPAGRVFLQKETPHVVHVAVGMKHDIDVEALKEAIKDSVLTKHPRFCSLMVRNRWGVEVWKKTDDIDIDRHVIVIDGRIDGDGDEAAVNDYLADLSLSSSFEEGKPLWEIHVLKQHNCMVMRIHHALGDGTSLLSMLQALCTPLHNDDRPDSVSSTITLVTTSSRRSWWFTAKLLVQRLLLSVVFIVGFIFRSLSWVKDRKNPIIGGDGVELWPRKLATARFTLDDMNIVKKSVLPGGATINDVLIGVISAGLHRYIDRKWPGSMQPGMKITGIVPVSLRNQPGFQWGNLIGIMLLPLNYSGSGTNPLDHVSSVKEMLDRKKSSFEAAFSYWSTGLVTSWFGSKAASNILRKIFCNTTFTVSNMVGPREGIAYLGNPITYVRVNVSSLPQSLAMHMVSYAGRADLQIMVAKEIIPDPEFLAECFEGALMDMKVAVLESKI